MDTVGGVGDWGGRQGWPQRIGRGTIDFGIMGDRQPQPFLGFYLMLASVSYDLLGRGPALKSYENH